MARQSKSKKRARRRFSDEFKQETLGSARTVTPNTRVSKSGRLANKSRVNRALDSLPGMTIAPCQLRPESRGSIHLKSPDAFAAPAIRPNFLATRTDRDTVVAGMQLGRRIIEGTPLNPYRGVELIPGPDVQSDDEFLAYARETGATVYHPVGTCKMGRDDLAVADARLRAHGLEALRVVDASIMATLVSSNTNAPAIMIAEKAADTIREDAATAQRLAS